MATSLLDELVQAETSFLIASKPTPKSALLTLLTSSDFQRRFSPLPTVEVEIKYTFKPVGLDTSESNKRSKN